MVPLERNSALKPVRALPPWEIALPFPPDTPQVADQVVLRFPYWSYPKAEKTSESPPAVTEVCEGWTL